MDGALGIQTRGRKMVGADETLELWWQTLIIFKYLKFVRPVYKCVYCFRFMSFR